MSPLPAGISIVRPPRTPVRCSVICVSNDPATLQRYLLDSLSTQLEPHELIVVNSNVFRATGAAQALNAGAAHALGTWVVFVHQDVMLRGDDFLTRMCDAAERLPDAGIVGIMGAVDAPVSQIALVNQITQGDPDAPFSIGTTPVAAPTRVDTVDELLFAIPRALYATMPLDEAACPAWDLYAVDYSLSVRAGDLSAYVLPLTVHHRSVGKLSARYYDSLRRVINKHRANHAKVCTTCGTWTASTPVPLQRCRKLARSARHRLTRWIR